MKALKITVFLSLFCVPIHGFSLSTIDSLGLKNTSEKKFILHKVKSSETLYSLLKKYNCSLEEIQMANVELKANNTIYINQIIKFPVQTAILSSRGAAEIKKSSTPTSTIHTVKPSETLYSIGKLYDVSIESLKQINHLQLNGIKYGQTLIIHQETNTSPVIVKTEEIKRNKYPDNIKPEKIIVPNAPHGERISEFGIAEVIQTNNKSSKMLALHKTAPLGSLMTIKNEATGDRIMVKVIGKLPDTGNNENIIVRLSPSAFYKLDPKDIRIRAEVAYYLPPSL